MKPKSFIVIVGLLVLALSGGLFIALAQDVLFNGSMTLYDPAVSHWLLGLTTTDRSQFFYLVTLLGNAEFILLSSLLVGGWLTWRNQWLDLGALTLCVGGGAEINLLLKNVFMRPRPDIAKAFYQEIGYSFPSGHAMLSVLFYGMTAYLLARQGLSWKAQTRLSAAAFIFSLSIGFSRIFLGVHYLTDVLGGWAVGMFWLAVCVLLHETLRELAPRFDPERLPDGAARPSAHRTGPG